MILKGRAQHDSIWDLEVQLWGSATHDRVLLLQLYSTVLCDHDRHSLHHWSWHLPSLSLRTIMNLASRNLEGDGGWGLAWRLLAHVMDTLCTFLGGDLALILALSLTYHWVTHLKPRFEVSNSVVFFISTFLLFLMSLKKTLFFFLWCMVCPQFFVALNLHWIGSSHWLFLQLLWLVFYVFVLLQCRANNK